MFIYKITNTITRKSYIGQTKNPINKRFCTHISEANRSVYDTYLHRSIRKYGKENFIIELIEKCNEDNIHDREKYWISELNTKAPNGYNLHDGGNGGCLNPSDELRQKLSAAKRNYVPWNKGKVGAQKHSIETRNKMSQTKTEWHKNRKGGVSLTEDTTKPQELDQAAKA